MNHREQLVHVIRSRRTTAGVNPLLEIGVVKQSDLAVVEHLELLPLAQGFDGETQLLLSLVHRVVEQVGDPGVDLQDGLRDGQLVLARLELIVHERPGQHLLALVTGRQLDGRLAGLVLALEMTEIDPAVMAADPAVAVARATTVESICMTLTSGEDTISIATARTRSLRAVLVRVAAAIEVVLHPIVVLAHEIAVSETRAP